jgi:hypothetical protein
VGAESDSEGEAGATGEGVARAGKAVVMLPCRLFRRSPALSAVAIASLALGIGASVTVAATSNRPIAFASRCR